MPQHRAEGNLNSSPWIEVRTVANSEAHLRHVHCCVHQMLTAHSKDLGQYKGKSRTSSSHSSSHPESEARSPAS
eukprot:3360856-Alexandrium_andersonii.AAC.1